MGAITTWIVAILYDASFIALVVSSLVMGLGILGTSLFYFGVANFMYARKNKIFISKPIVNGIFIVFGLLGILYVIYITFNYLNIVCQCIVVLDALIIICYYGILSRHWQSKNLSIAIVCASPILLGMFTSESSHPSIPSAVLVAFFAYLAREIIKDIQDIETDRSYRQTLPLRFDILLSRHIACVFMTLSIVFLIRLMSTISLEQWYVFIPIIVASIYFVKVIYSLGLCLTGKEAIEAKYIILGSVCLIFSFVLLSI